MKKPKQKYEIFAETTLDYGDGHIDTTRERVGETWAVSEAQAINNYCYRNGTHNYEVHEWRGDGGRTVSYTAKLSTN